MMREQLATFLNQLADSFLEEPEVTLLPPEQAGLRSALDIGPKTMRIVGRRTRIFGGLNPSTAYPVQLIESA